MTDTEPVYYLDAGDQIDSMKTWDIYPPEDDPVGYLVEMFQRTGQTPAAVLQHLLDLPSARGMPADLKAKIEAAIRNDPR